MFQQFLRLRGFQWHPPRVWCPAWVRVPGLRVVLSVAAGLGVPLPVYGQRSIHVIRPDTLRLSDTSTTTTFTLVNLTDTAKSLWLALDCGAAADSSERDDLLADAWRNASACALPWLIGMPHHLVLRPHERHSVSLTAVPYPTLPDGRYTARVYWATLISFMGDTTTISHSFGFPVVYQKGLSGPHPPRTHWRATLPAPSGAAEQKSVIQASPEVLVLDDRSQAAEVTLHNTGADSVQLWLALDCPWFRDNLGGLNSSQFESAWHARIPSAVFWLGGYPDHVTLAPHETRKIPVAVFPLPVFGEPAGNYYARIVYVQSPRLVTTPDGDTLYMTPHGAIPVVVQRGHPSTAVTIQDLRVEKAMDGTRHACVAVQFPGIGLVASVHAEIDDAHGASVRKIHQGQSTQWQMDTTMSLWGVVHHDPEDVDHDAEQKAPDPVCLPLPMSRHGASRLVVTVTLLEDGAKQPAIRRTLTLTGV